MKMTRLAVCVLLLAFVIPVYGAWTYTEDGATAQGNGSGTLTDGTWTFVAEREKNTQNLTVKANLGSSTATEPCAIDFTAIEGGYRVVSFNQFSSQHGEYQSDIKGSKLYSYRGLVSEFIAPDCIEITGEGCFKGCSNLCKVVLNELVLIKHGRAFEGCTSLSELSPRRFASITALYVSTFMGCSALEGGLEFPNCTSFAQDSFNGCLKLGSVKAEKAIEIGQAAFADCSNLSNVVLSAAIATIKNNAFLRCRKITTEFVQGLLHKELKQLGNSITDRNGCFRECAGLTGTLVWNLPNLKTNAVPDFCFQGCSSLERVVIESPVSVVGNYAFRNIKNGAEVHLPETPAAVYGEYAISCDNAPFLRVYFGGNADAWMEAMYAAVKNHLIKKDEFDDASWVSKNRADINRTRIVDYMMMKDATMCSKVDGQVAVNDRKVLGFLMSDTNAGCWVLRSPPPRTGFRFVLR